MSEKETNIRKRIIRLSIIFVLGVIIGFVLIIAVNALPTDNIRKNLKESVNIIFDEGYVYPIKQLEGACLDNFTDALVMSGCAYESDQSVIKHAMNIPVVMGNPIKYFDDYLKGNEVQFYNYARYWHGYQVILKPVYSVMNYYEFRYVNFTVQLCVVCYLLWILLKQKKYMQMVAFMIAYLSIQPLTIGLNTHFSWVLYIALIASIVIVKKREKLKDSGESVLLIAGMCTSYMDLISAPLITLGIPLFFLLDNERGKWKIKDLFVNSLVWCIGYAGMWISKWVIGSIILGRSVLTEAMDIAKYRAGNKDGWWELLAYEVIEENWRLIPAAKILTICVAVMLFVFIFFRKDGVRVLNKQYLLLSLFPIIWILCMQNHSWVHYYFTYRILAILVISLAYFLLSNLYYNRNQLKGALFKKQVPKNGVQ